ncbi:hypothetical protein A3A38_01085 [Candidatus Kaiserbacteria bacterium RIFCSPLOWO2_01_FULL_53_17]|uniref:LamG-like jellyroll fold domain-containing protein n=1 Tax=Candidatus Kaiserbacteria bacterium RIFCSPLOWO2_01_FULL_53_17 TaxID=1798511 RepID=A0A1F6EH67_9BACT|nr:MAG: hypothetical protein A3A38_01085 [Candidatus Kaiserbacteria bacterium RIFCSPLOWO2_01_FULL_53_17]
MSSRTATLGALLIAGAFLIAASLIPFDLTAQESDPITASCVRLTRSLYLGRTDSETNGEVTKLQRFLTQTGDFTYGHTTGYFGPLTEAAVQQWQCRNMQLCSGGPEENGWGVVGPQTRRAMRVGCDASFPPAPPPYPSNASCTLDGVTVLHGQSWIFYSTNTVQSPNTCSSVAQTRTCTNGTLSGSNTYNRASCTVAGGVVTTPVAEWKFDEASGATALDSSGNGNNGILENGATRYVGTQQGNKLELDGVDDRMRVDTVSSNILNMESFTLAAWVRPTEYGGIIMRKGNTERGRFNFGINSDGRLYLRSGHTTQQGVWQTVNTLPLNTWFHVAVTYSFSSLSNKPTFYVNGVPQELRSSVPNPGTYDPADPIGTPVADTSHLYLGNNQDFVNRSQVGFDSAFEGRMDIVRVYNAILSASEIQSLFNGAHVDDTPANNASCTLDGITLLHSESKTFYSTNTVPWGQSCSSVSQSRTCTNGTLSGSSAYNKASCTVAGGGDTTSSGNFSATPQSGPAPLTVTFAGSYDAARPAYGGVYGKAKIRVIFGDGSAPLEQKQNCTSELFKGIRCALSNVSHTYAAGSYTAKIALVWYGNMDGYPFETELSSEQLWSATITAGSTGASCTHNGQTYASGQMRSETTQCPSLSSWPPVPPDQTIWPDKIVCLNLNRCTNGRWVAGSRWEFRPPSYENDAGWPGGGLVGRLPGWSGGTTVMPVAGSAPLTVEVESDITFPLSTSYPSPAPSANYKLRVNFGDMSPKVSFPSGSTAEQTCGIVKVDTDFGFGEIMQGQCKLNTVHTYTDKYPPDPWYGSPPGFLPDGYPASVQLLKGLQLDTDYAVKFEPMRTLWKGTIVVTSGTQADTGSSLQLANALTALEEALKGLLNFLTR